MNLKDSTLILVHFLTRHGNKTPDLIAAYPNDPHKGNDYYPYGCGNLTNEGKRVMYDTGKQLRQRYNDFLGDLYFSHEVETWSTDFERTRASAQLLLAGLFPPKHQQIWNESLCWQPIPVNYSPFAEDELLLGYATNKDFIKLYMENFQTEYGQSLLKKHAETIEYIEQQSGLKIPSTRQCIFLRDTIKIQLEMGLKQLKWTKSVYPGKLNEFAYMEYEMATYTKELRRLLSGKLLKKILTDSLNKINQKSRKKIHIYSAHDVNTAHLLITLGIFFRNFPNADWVLPDHASVLALELHKIGERYGFKLFYKKNVNSDFKAVDFKDGQEILWIDEYEKIVNDLFSED